MLAGLGTILATGKNLRATAAENQSPNGKPFNLKYAFHPGQFRANAGDDIIDQIKWAYEQGFRAMEDNGMSGRTPALQEKIGQTLRDRQMEMGVFVGHAIDWQKPLLTTGDPEIRKTFLQHIKNNVEVAQRCGAKWMVVVPGLMSYNRDLAYQKAIVLDQLREAVAILEPHKLGILLETLNFRDHPSQVLPDVANIYSMVKSVNSPYCKIQFDIYHVQIQTGNLIPNIDLSWDETAYFQIGDNPGRKEPTTGEINYKNVFKHLYNKGYKGVLGMEHGTSGAGKEGELALIQAYREVDSFL